MAIFDRFNIKVVASAGLFGAAIAMCPDAAATPLKTGGACIQGQAGDIAPLPAAGGVAGAGAGAPAAAGACGAAGTPAMSVIGAAGACGAAPMTDMAGVPMAFPGPVPVVPLAPPIPLVPPVPVVPAGVPVGAPLPIGAPLVAMGGDAPGAPLIDMSGVKDAPMGPAPTGGPIAGQPIQPGPAARPPS
ncbi:proline, glycine, valine-rich secreted protein [Mycobacterium rhizamassiliense]|uniref:Proline, glycine, valine-rich secreted protein n=2 Tax=Mycobacterium rhizamassiliense TaxID=1841860 RepID=A0A2U3NP97_9MYCO|nr:proline, glycine, valine-rich secreted protein [Mycobacterium rhizamassiliense]